MIGLVDMVASPAELCCAGGHSAAHISSIITAPAAAEIRRPMPRVTATPIAKRPAMNRMSAHHVPTQAWNVDSNGPTSTRLRKPLVGELPENHALLLCVA